MDNSAPAVATRRFDTPIGRVDALIDGDVVRARGIRYARATRFGAPVVEAPGTDVVEAHHPAPACVQVVDPPPGVLRVDGLAGLDQSEDCLRVTVTVPSDVADDEGLPVLVWIHGGAYRNGAADSPLYDPAALVREQRVVVVNVGYRLGVLGYLSGTDRPANLGLLDQREALRWVQRAIAGFGGDPDRVTVMGESAGADAIAHLMISDDVLDCERPLFGRAILQSAPLGTTRGRIRLRDLQAAVLADIADDGALPDLMALDARVAASGQSAGLAGMMPYGVQYGHEPLPPVADADRRWREVAPYVDVLAGTNAREVALYQDVPPFPTLRPIPVLGSAVGEVLIRVMTMAVFTRPTAAFVRRHQRSGGRARRYVFHGGVAGNPLQASHAAELPYLFSGPGWTPSSLLDGTSPRQVDQLGRGIRQMWADFARTGVADDGTARELLRLVD